MRPLDSLYKRLRFPWPEMPASRKELGNGKSFPLIDCSFQRGPEQSRPRQRPAFTFVKPEVNKVRRYEMLSFGDDFSDMATPEMPENAERNSIAK